MQCKNTLFIYADHKYDVETKKKKKNKKRESGVYRSFNLRRKNDAVNVIKIRDKSVFGSTGGKKN